MFFTLLRTSQRVLLLLFVCFSALSQLYAQTSITAVNTPYTENFNSLPNSGTTPFVANSTLTGAYVERTTATSTTLLTGTGSSNTGGLYSFGASGSTDRALGTVGSGSAGNFALGFRYQNNTGTTITSLKIDYTGEQWRNGGGTTPAAQTATFSYLVGTDLTSLTPSASLPNGYVAVSNLDFTSPVFTATAGALDGNADANRVVKSYTITGLNIAPGQEIMLRWYDIDHPGSDHALAFDDLTVTANPTGGPVTAFSANPTTLTGFSTNVGTPSAPKSYTLSGSNLTGSTVSITAPEGVEVSLDGSSYNTTQTVSPSTEGNLSQPVFVRLKGSAIATISGTITNTFNGTLNAPVTVSGLVNDPNVVAPISLVRSQPNGTAVSSLPGGKFGGRVTVSNQFGSTVYIQDATAGISVFSPALAQAVQIGDQVQITGGTINAFNQNKQIDGSVTFTILGDNQPVAPKVITANQLASYEGQLVSIENAQIRPNTVVDSPNPVFVLTPDSNVKIQDGSGSIDLRVSRFTNLPGNNTPGTPTTVTGVVARFNSTLQLQPRFTQDIPGTTPYAPAGGNIDRSKTLDVAAWNIEWLGNTANGPSNETQQFTNAATVLNGLQSDIIVLEEISSPNAITQLLQGLPGYQGNCSPFVSNNPGHEIPANPATPGNSIPGDAQRVCILYKSDVATLISQKPLLERAGPLPGYPADPSNFWASGRYPYMWTFDVKVDNITRRLNVIGIHAKANTSPEQTSYDRRKYDVQVLYDSLKAQYPSDLLLLAGDFNDDLDRTVADVPNTESTYKQFADDAANYSVLTRPLSDNGFRTYLSLDNVIDQIVVSNELAPAYVPGSAGVGTPYLTIPDYVNTTSDHIPVFARFDLSKLIDPLAITTTVSASTICADGTVQLTANVTGGLKDYQYNWTGPGTIANGNTATATVSALAAGPQAFTVLVTDAQSNTISATASVTVANALAKPAITANPASQTIYQGAGDIQLEVTNCTGTVNWTGGTGTGEGNRFLTQSSANVGVFSYTAVCTQNGCQSEAATISLTVVSPLSVYYQDGDNGNNKVTNNAIRPYLRLQNDGPAAIPYQELTVRYWFTAENFATVNTAIDYAQLGTNKVKAKYVALDQPRNGALGYIEYSFDGSAGTLGGNSNTGPIQSRIFKQDYTNFNEADDYSYGGFSTFTKTDRITVYRNGQLVWGVEPTPVAPMLKLKVSSENKNHNTNSNSINTFLKITNEGNVPVNYQDLTVRYWFSNEGSKPLNFFLDYAMLGNSNIRAQFGNPATPLAGADTYLEVGFVPTLGVLAPQSNTGNIQYRISKNDWSNFNEANDYSYKPAGSMVDNDRITVYYQGQLVYGTEPSTPATGRLAAAEPGTGLNVEVLGNPVVGETLPIRITGAAGQALSIRVTDMQGRTLTTHQIDRAADRETLSLPLGSQSASTLLLQVTTATEQKAVKVLKQ